MIPAVSKSLINMSEGTVAIDDLACANITNRKMSSRKDYVKCLLMLNSLTNGYGAK